MFDVRRYSDEFSQTVYVKLLPSLLCVIFFLNYYITQLTSSGLTGLLHIV